MAQHGVERAPMETETIEVIKKISEDVVEMYSSPRVALEAREFGLNTGEAMDLTTGWDFSAQQDQDKAMQYLREYKPKLVIGSPTCRMFSQLQRLSP